MSSRHTVLALSKTNTDKYEEARIFLRHFIYLVKNMSAGDWKPVQSGIVLSTTSILHLAEHLLATQSFLLTSRLTQDCLENLFSSVRYKNPNPTCREFRYALKTIMIAQFLTNPSTGSYSADDREHLAEFLDEASCIPTDDKLDDLLLAVLDESFTLSIDEANSLYYLAGYVLQSLKKQKQTCEACFNAALRLKDEPIIALPAKLAALKEFTNKESLCYVSKSVHDQFVVWEQVIRQLSSSAITTPNIRQHMYENCMLHAELTLPTCHHLLTKLCTKFIDVCLHILARKFENETLRANQLSWQQKCCYEGNGEKAKVACLDFNCKYI